MPQLPGGNRLSEIGSNYIAAILALRVYQVTTRILQSGNVLVNFFNLAVSYYVSISSAALKRCQNLISSFLKFVGEGVKCSPFWKEPQLVLRPQLRTTTITNQTSAINKADFDNDFNYYELEGSEKKEAEDLDDKDSDNAGNEDSQKFLRRILSMLDEIKNLVRAGR